MGTISLGGVEGETVRLGFLDGYAGLRIDQVLGPVALPSVLGVEHGYGSFAQVQGCGERVPDASGVGVPGLELVHHQVYEVGLVAVQGSDFGQFRDLSVYAALGVAPLAELVEEFLVMSLPAPDQRRQQVAFPVPVGLHHQLEYLLVGVSDHLDARFGGICPRGLGVQKPQEVIYLGYGSDRGPGVVARGLLLYGYDGAEAADLFHVGLLEHTHEVLGIGAQGIHIPSLSFGVYGVEGEG